MNTAPESSTERVTHTPEPWVAHEKGHVLTGPDGYEIRTADGERYIATIRGPVDAEDEANAEYIVRACNSFPDLLAALETVSGICRKKYTMSAAPAHDLASEIWPIMQAAIAKARGEVSK